MQQMSCPQCGVSLTIPEGALGKTVVCGACSHRFTASMDGFGAEGAGAQPGAWQPPGPQAPPPAAPYPPMPGYGPPGYPYPQQKTSGRAIASMVLGIISIPSCIMYGVPSLVCGILAVVFSKSADAEVQAGLASPSSTGLAKTGRICGWVGIGLSIAFLALIVIYVVILGFALSR